MRRGYARLAGYISILAPVRRRPRRSSHRSFAYADFNSRPREEASWVCAGNRRRPCDFNSRPREEASQILAYAIYLCTFQFSPP